MTEHAGLREQAAGITGAMLALFAIATVVYGLFDYNVYTDLLGLDRDQLRYLYVLFALLAIERLHDFATGGMP